MKLIFFNKILKKEINLLFLVFYSNPFYKILVIMYYRYQNFYMINSLEIVVDNFKKLINLLYIYIYMCV